MITPDDIPSARATPPSPPPPLADEERSTSDAAALPPPHPPAPQHRSRIFTPSEGRVIVSANDPGRSDARRPPRAAPLVLAALLGNIVGGALWVAGLQGAVALMLVGAVLTFCATILGIAAIYRVVRNLDDTAMRVYEITQGAPARH